MAFEVKVEPGTPLCEAMINVLADDEPLTLKITPPWTEYVYEKGDRVQAAFDNGWGPATIEGADRDFIRISYGTGNRYRTSLDRYGGSIRTDHKVEHPAKIEVIS